MPGGSGRRDDSPKRRHGEERESVEGRSSSRSRRRHRSRSRDRHKSRGRERKRSHSERAKPANEESKLRRGEVSDLFDLAQRQKQKKEPSQEISQKDERYLFLA